MIIVIIIHILIMLVFLIFYISVVYFATKVDRSSTDTETTVNEKKVGLYRNQ